VLEAFIAIRERALVAGAEALLLDDFLTYVENYFPALGPFRTLGLARGNRYRQHRRLRQLLGEATGLEAVIDGYGPLVAASAGAGIGERAYLWIASDDEQVELAVFPADTLTQAREFYTRPSAVDGLNRLPDQPGWVATPNSTSASWRRALLDQDRAERRRVLRVLGPRDRRRRRGRA
jgi:hypothetical protein